MKHRTNLNHNQKEILENIYKYRFVSASLIAKQKEISRVSVMHSLNLLVDRGLLTKRFDKSYRLLGKPASYCLSTKAVPFIKQNIEDASEQAIQAIYQNKRISEEYVDVCMQVYKLAIAIEQKYPNAFDIYTRTDQAGGEEYPKPSPNLYLQRKTKHSSKPNYYFIDIFPGAMQFVIRKRIDTYIVHFDEGDWTEDEYPTVLIGCPSDAIAKKLAKYVERAKDDSYIDDEELVVKTFTALPELS